MHDRRDIDAVTLEACRLGDADAFRRLVEAYRRPSGPATLRGWILCIARRLCQDRARVLGRRGRVTPIADDTASDDVLDPGAALERADRDARVGRAIAALPSDQRAALALYEWEGLDYEAIAAREAVPVGTVRSRLFRARAALRAALAAVVAACRGAARTTTSSATRSQETSMIAKLALAFVAAAGAIVTVHVVRSGDSPIARASRAPTTQAVANAPAASPTDHAAPAHARVAPPSRVMPPAPARHAGGETPCDHGLCDPAAHRPAVPERADLDLANAPSMGPASAKVTIVEITDFQCPFCEKAVATIEDLAALYPDDVRVVVKNMPLPGHRFARGAAIAAVAAQRQGKYWEMHEMLFANQSRLDRASLVEHARTLGLDTARFERDLDDPAIAQAVDADLAEAMDKGFQGTPSFTINGRVVVGARPLEDLRQIVDEELAKVR
jgi:RNA polymerase sigma factor (sigma-70 family)